jgi:feruloyl esterase
MIGTLSFVLLAATAATPCENLKSLSLPGTSITISELVPEQQQSGRGGPGERGRGATAAGRGAPPVVDAERGGIGARGPVPDPSLGGRGPGFPARGGERGIDGARGGGRGAAESKTVPAHCRVVAVLRPTADSEINMELWLPPANRWNGKFQMAGNGGWGGSLQGLESAMPEALRLGYATAATDTGHRGGGEFALGHPERVIDFAYRAVHEVAIKSKVLIHNFYDQAPRLSYFNSCSGGGRQALMEAQRYPEDFDGIIAGDPANPQIALHASTVDRAVDTIKDPAGFIPREKVVNVLAPAVMKACDAADGVKDNLVSNPMACKFDPTVLLCKSGDRANCLTAKQVETAKRNYAPTKTSNGELVFPGMSFGMEGAGSIMTGAAAPQPLSLDTFRFLGHQDRQWDWRNFNLDADLELARKNAGFIDAGADLTAFKARGGKLLMYHGWADSLIAPESSVNYRANVLETMGPDQDSWLRLFMVPGMGHCTGGQGPTEADWLGALEKWREKGTAPDAIIGAGTLKGQPITRPLCPYPQVPFYKGKGNVNNAENFVCKK